MARQHPQFQSSLRDKAQELLNEYLRYKTNSIIQISIDTKLSTTWIGMFSRNEIKHTDVGRVETLYNYLNKQPLKV
jgi:hypothetical protein